MKTVTFCGHRELASGVIEELATALYNEIEKLIKSGADTFLLGGYGQFDRLCAETVKKLKDKYPHITSTLVIPYIDRDYDRDLYDNSEYPPIENTPKRFAISARNKYMVEKSDAVISYVVFPWGGAYDTLSLAKRKKKFLINL